jgi:hypothetical protein
MYDAATLEIINWSKFNPRKDLKATTWFRLQNTLFEDPNLFEWSHSELLFWIYLLSLASKKQSGIIRLSYAHATRIGRFEVADVESAIQKLIELECVRIVSVVRNEDVTSTSHARDTTDERTDETNETERTDEENSEQIADVNPLEAKLRAFDPDGKLEQEFQARKVGQEVQRAWLDAYPDPKWIIQEVFKALAWEKANPHKRKKNLARFIGNWLSKGWDDHTTRLPSNPARGGRGAWSRPAGAHERDENLDDVINGITNDALNGTQGGSHVKGT